MSRHQQESDNNKWVHDSSVDYKGRVPLRATTGSWKACFFIIASGFSERLCYFGLAANMIVYLTTVLNQDTKTAVRNVNYWTGVTTLMPLLGGFLADAYFGQFTTVVVASVIYLMGFLLLTMSQVIPSLKPCGLDPCHEPRKIHELFFFFAIYLISIGTGGHKPAVESFGADQFDPDHPKERISKISFFNWWIFWMCIGVVLSLTAVVYVQDHVGWAALYIVVASVMTFSMVIFCVGRPFYRFRKPRGSPLTPLLQVLVAAVVKRNVVYPSRPEDLYEVQNSDMKNRARLLFHTNKLKFLDKAAIIEETQIPTDKQNHSPWRLSTVTNVEGVKLIINMFPIWVTSIPFGLCMAQSNTFFIKQSMLLDRKLSDSFTIPSASMFAFSFTGIMFFVTIYDKLLVPFLRRATGNERGINLLTRIGIGMIFSVLSMIVAAVVERKRLDVFEKESSSGSMSVFWITPQFLIISIADTFTIVGLQEYFYDQVPDAMRSLGIAFYLSVIGASSFLSNVMVTLVDRVSARKSGTSWFGKDLNHSRLDYFYYLVAGVTALDLCVYVFVAMRYSYKNSRKPAVAAVVDSDGSDGVEV